MVSQTVTTMEDRILDLLLPFRDECFDTSFTKEEPERLESSAKLERKTLSLARNLAFVVHNHRFKAEKHRRAKIEGNPRVNTEDVCIVVRGWDGSAVVADGGVIAVVVRYPAAMQTVVRTKLRYGDNVIDKLCLRVDNALKYDL